jgi:hypothetical protein
MILNFCGQPGLGNMKWILITAFTKYLFFLIIINSVLKILKHVLHLISKLIKIVISYTGFTQWYMQRFSF